MPYYKLFRRRRSQVNAPVNNPSSVVDIAGIVLNRWGHAYISPQPGFHFGKDGKDAPKDTVKKGFGRIQFGHSELSGYMSHTRALNEGARAADLAMEQI